MKISFFPQIACLLGLGFSLLCSCNQAPERCSLNASYEDPNFKVENHDEAFYQNFPKKVIVFDIPIYAASCVEDVKLLHAANILAQYLDNDEDGQVDNKAVVQAMHNNQAFMIIWYDESDLEGIEPMPNTIGQDLGNDETNPDFVVDGKTGSFDAALEEVWHIVTHAGYAYAYPTIFGEHEGTALTMAMDVARGGHFTDIPVPYPAEAWYSYDDETCDYSCMAAEYIYWGMTSILGAQENRANQIGNEWRLHTKAMMQETDTALYALLTDSTYKFPKTLPNGKYRRDK